MTDWPVLRPKEGWHVLHLFYRAELGQWQTLTSEERLSAKTKLSALVQEVRSLPSTQILTFSMVSPTADIGFMLLTDDLHKANSIVKKLTLSLGADFLTPLFRFYSLTDRIEYTTTEKDYAASLTAEKGLAPESCE
jgi:hydrogen peroxide-dependent heme synthase